MIGKASSFLLTKETFGSEQGKIEEKLVQMGIEHAAVIRSSLLLEEICYRLFEHKSKEVKVGIHRRFGAVSLRLTSEGEAYNPLSEENSWTEEEVDYFRHIVLTSNREWLGYSRRNGKNCLSIEVRKDKKKQVRNTLMGMALGLLVGSVLEEVLSPDLVSMIDTYALRSARTMFLNAMNMMLAPVVLFSIMAGIMNLSNVSEVGKMGRHMMGLYLVTSLCAAGGALFLGVHIFSGEFAQIGTAGDTAAAHMSLLDMIVGIVPHQFAEPVISGNMLQVIFLALLFGLTINSMGEKARPLIDIVNAMDTLCLRVIRTIVQLVPLVAFLSMASLVFQVGLESLWAFMEALLAQGLMLVFMLVVYGALVAAAGHLPPWIFLRKLAGFLPLPASLGSTNAAMPFSMELCVKKLGVQEKLAGFAIPMGASVKMDGNCAFLILQSIMLAKLYGIEVSSGFLMTLALTSVALSFGSPGVTGGAVICLASVAVSVGIPIEAIGMVLSVDPLVSMLRTPLNSAGGIAAALLLARHEHAVDESVYRAE